MKKTLVIIVILIAIAVIVYHRSARAATQTEQSPVLYCPEVSLLTKNHQKGNWTAETAQGLWKSYGLSFATRITQLNGAQWVGENVGQITCVYGSEQTFKMQGNTEIQPTLPVLLVFHILTFQPSTGKWQYMKNGVYNCVSHNKKDCPFHMNLKSQTGNIFEEAEKLKSKTNLNQPDF